MQSQQRVFLASLFLGLFGFISFNIYLPAISKIATSFHTTSSIVKHSLTLFLLGFSTSLFFWGSLSSKYGRKKAALSGLIVAGIGTCFAIASPTIELFNLSRLIEGFGVGCASVLWRTLLSDSLDQARLSKAMSNISSMTNVMPILAPLIGSYIIIFFNWEGIFIALLILDMLLIIFFYKYLDETNGKLNPEFSIKQAYFEYINVFTNYRALAYMMPYAIFSAGIIGYNAAAPFIFINHLHILAHHYAYLLILTVISYIVGARISNRICAKVGFDNTILIGTGLGIIPGVIYYLLSLRLHLSVTTVIIPMMTYTFMGGIVTPISNACALHRLKNIAGAGSAVLSTFVYSAAILTTYFIISLDLSKLTSLGLYTLTVSVTPFIIFYIIIKLKKE